MFSYHQPSPGGRGARRTGAGVAEKSFSAGRKLQMGTSSRRTGNSTHFQTQKIVEDLQELKISMKPKRTAWKVELLEVDFFGQK